MDQHRELPPYFQYRVPAVRHLAWMCHAPRLIGAPPGFAPAEHLPQGTEQTLRAWDKAPDHGPAILTETPARRLGHYFERLYHCLLEDLLGWEVLLENQPVRSNGITLGEMDFIVRNPGDDVIEHHEIAVKFYLGYCHDSQDERKTPLWYGPNSRDRLDLKSQRLLSHQSRLTEKPETRDLLHSLGVPIPARSRIYMPGYLFYPTDQSIAPPENVPADHLRGRWLYIDDLDRLTDESRLPESLRGEWVPLVKPHWLGPWCQTEAPQQHHTEQALDTVRSTGTPRLFAVLWYCPQDCIWKELTRLFVVPRHWPVQ